MTHSLLGHSVPRHSVPETLSQCITQSIMASIEPPTKRICLVAPKGSALNNPFRMLPSDVLANILSMTKGWTPTPSALAIKEAGMRCDWDGGYLMAYVGPRDGAFFLEGWFGRELEQTHFLTFRAREERFNPALGVVVTRTWTRLRQHHDFEDSLDYMQTLMIDHDITDWSGI